MQLARPVIISSLSKLLLLPFAFSWACTPKVDEPEEQKEVFPTAIIISSRELTVERGGSDIITVSFIPEEVSNKTLDWHSADPSIATVEDGKVTGVKPGTTEIYVTAWNITDKCIVTVVNRPGEIGLTEKNLIFYEGERVKIIPDVFPAGVTGPMTWTSSNNNVISVDNDGNIRVLSPGKATITASCGNLTASSDAVCYTPLTLEAIENGVITISNPLNRSIVYCVNNSEQKSDGDIVINVSAGDAVRLYGSAESYALGLGKATNIRCSSPFYAYGSIMSLIHSGNLSRVNELCEENTFCCLFKNNKELFSHPQKDLELPAEVLQPWCYDAMFSECTSMSRAPELPATVLAEHCYSDMFWDCKSLTTAPDLPATTLAPKCYSWMFNQCSNLTSAPSILPATELEEWCYSYMFSGCAITKAPELPATKLVFNCYYGMFSGCKKLRYIKALFTSEPGGTTTGDWVYCVPKTGIFVKSKEASWDVRGDSGIPPDWTVEIAE